MVGGKLTLFVLAATANSAWAKRQKVEASAVDRESNANGNPRRHDPRHMKHRRGHRDRHEAEGADYPMDEGMAGQVDPPPACGTKDFKVMMVGPWGSRRDGDIWKGPEEIFDEFRPNKDVVIVDPLSSTIPKEIITEDNVDLAEGASKSLYKTIGILDEYAGGDDEADSWNGFPAEVISSLNNSETGMAKYHAYTKAGDKLTYDTNIIHVFAPDLRRFHEEHEAEDTLAKAYNNVLKEFLQSGKNDLRILPLSDGIWSGEVGPHKKKISEMTFTAFTKAVDQLDAAHKEDLKSKLVQFCIYMNNKMDEYLTEARKKCPEAQPR